MTQVRIGCSGWAYRDWQGVVYPPATKQREWFEHYQRGFDTVELNSTFYRLPSAMTVERWAAAARPGFVYAVKLGAFGSHRKKLSDVESWLPRHLARLCSLGDHLGPTLVQLPPTWRRDSARLDHFLSAAPRSMRWAVEFRDASWLHDDVFAVLAHHGAALCIHDLLREHPFELTTDWTYIRFHGPRAVERRYEGHYSQRRLGDWAARLGRLRDQGNDVYCYFNNDIRGAAPVDARRLRTLMHCPPT